MAYENNNNQNQNQQFTVTTSLLSFFDDASYQLRIAGLESALSISIWTPAVSPEGKVTYPREARVNLNLHPANVKALFDAIMDKEGLLENFQNGKDDCVGLYSNNARTNMVTVSCRSGDFYLNLYKEIGEDKKPKQVYQFKFVKTPVIHGYDPNTGEFEVKPVESQFGLFVKTLEAYSMIGEMAGHSVRTACKFTISKFYDYLGAIAAKVGATLPQNYPPRNNYNNYQSQYGATPANYAQGSTEPAFPVGDGSPYGAPIQEVDSVSGLF